MDFENLKLQMFQVENSVLLNPETAHVNGDSILLEALDQLTPLVKDANQHDALVDLIAAYKRASQYFYYA